MKKQLFQTVWSVGCTAGLAFFCGCVGAGVDTGVEIGTTTVNNFGSGPKAQQVAAAPVKPAPKAAKIILLDQKRDLLRLSFKQDGLNADERALSGKIVSAMTNAVSSEDAIVGRKGVQDLQLSVRPQLTTVDQTGEYYRMNCTLQLELKAVVSGQILGGKKIKIVGKRVLGKDAAVAQFESAAAEAAAEWCRSELKRIADTEMSVAVLNIQLPTPKPGTPRKADKDAAAIRTIGEHLAKMPNFISYELIGQDAQTGTCQYRIAYFKSAYPNGVANEVSALVGSIVTHK